MKPTPEHALGLLEKAANDLIAADVILDSGMALDTVGFHAQQAVEKSLKAMLSYYGVEYPRRHDLSELLTMVLEIVPDMVQFQSVILPLNPYAIDVRYDDAARVREEDAVQALEAAGRVYRYICHQLGLGYENPEDWYSSKQG